MSIVSHLQGIASGTHYPADQLMNLDPVDGRPVEIVLDIERLRAEQPDLAWYRPEEKSLWRFGGLLALDPGCAEDRQYIVSLGEGFTPTLPYPEFQPARQAGLALCLKDDGKAHPGYGSNPTQSFKDRGMAMVASMARRFGLNRLVVPTQGNAGDSLAEYAHAAGLKAAVIMPEDTPLPIKGKVAAFASQYDGFRFETVTGTIREAGERMKSEYLSQGWFNVATFQEPGWRIEGKKTLGLEIAEPRMPGERWTLPDAIVYPTGGGTGVLGMWKAFDELQALGLIGSERPRIYCVQSAATTPLVTAFENGSPDTLPATAGDTLAYGLNVPGGVGHFKVLDIIRRSGGIALAVDEEQIKARLAEVWREKRWWVCPEGAACLAAIPMLLDAGELKSGETVLVINTGSLEKYLPELRHLL